MDAVWNVCWESFINDFPGDWSKRALISSKLSLLRTEGRPEQRLSTILPVSRKRSTRRRIVDLFGTTESGEKCMNAFWHSTYDRVEKECSRIKTRWSYKKKIFSQITFSFDWGCTGWSQGRSSTCGAWGGAVVPTYSIKITTSIMVKFSLVMDLWVTWLLYHSVPKREM
jgi:hypothetical protein